MSLLLGEHGIPNGKESHCKSRLREGRMRNHRPDPSDSPQRRRIGPCGRQRRQLTPISSPHHEEEAGEDADVEEALLDLEKVVRQCPEQKLCRTGEATPKLLYCLRDRRYPLEKGTATTCLLPHVEESRRQVSVGSSEEAIAVPRKTIPAG